MPCIQSIIHVIDRAKALGLAAFLISLVLIFQVPGEPVQAAAVTIHMSNPACVQAQPATGSCSILINSLNASGSDPSFSRLELLVNGKLRLYEAGFFETSAYFTTQMVPNAIKVSCGGPNAGGLAGYGQGYLITANAYMADGTSASNSMKVYCPAYDGKTFLPSVRR